MSIRNDLSTNLFDLTGRTALVTGASRGIGQALAVGLAQFGANVVCVARSIDGLTETVGQIESVGRGKGLALPADLRSEDSIQEVIDSAVESFDGLDILVNNAADDHDSSIEETDLATWQRVVELNLQSCFLLCKYAGPHLKQDKGGKVINVASMLASVGIRNNSAYVAAKSGLAGFTRAIALEWARANVQVNTLAPGFVKTAMTEAAWSDEAGSQAITRRTPMGRWGEVEDLIGATVFLASDASAFMTGEIVHVDGGWVAQ